MAFPSVLIRDSSVHLVQNVTDRRQRVDTLAERPSTEVGAYQTEHLRPENQIKPRRKGLPSLASVHTLDDLPAGATGPYHPPSLPDRVEIDPFGSDT